MIPRLLMVLLAAGAIVQLLHSRGHHKTVGILKLVVSAIVMIFCTSVGIAGWSTLGYAWDRNLSTYSLY